MGRVKAPFGIVVLVSVWADGQSRGRTAPSYLGPVYRGTSGCETAQRQTALDVKRFFFLCEMVSLRNGSLTKGYVEKSARWRIRLVKKRFVEKTVRCRKVRSEQNGSL